MIYTIIYKLNNNFNTFTFATKHDTKFAWNDYIENYAEEGQVPVAMYPGNNVIYFERDINETS
jgi:hypothetical protein|tara:strand:+ start:179 stop:367 length:189 start_codon:yes stop_codon:yes gene_type:complete